MRYFFDWLLGNTHRKELLDKIEEQRRELKIQEARLDRRLAALDGEANWFDRACKEHIAKQEIKEGIRVLNGTVATSALADSRR